MAQVLHAPEDAPEGGMVCLAEKLVKRLGMKDAQRVCRENSWYGVLRVIQNLMNNGAHT